MTLPAKPDEEPGDFIDEDPMEKAEFHEALYHYLPRSDRRRLWKALVDAELIVFRA